MRVPRRGLVRKGPALVVSFSHGGELNRYRCGSNLFPAIMFQQTFCVVRVWTRFWRPLIAAVTRQLPRPPSFFLWTVAGMSGFALGVHGAPLGFGCFSTWPFSPASLPLITTVEQLRRLSPEEAARGMPVRLRGVITYHEPSNYLTFIQDKTAGAYVGVDRGTDRSSGLKVGQWVEVEGVTSPGKFAPFVEGRGLASVKSRVIGHSEPPDPVQISMGDLTDPRFHCQWVEIPGVVRSVIPGEDERDPGRIHVDLHTAAGRIRVIIPNHPAGDPLPLQLVDSGVKVRGVFGSRWNERRQLIGSHVLAPSVESIEVIKSPAVTNSFELPVRPVGAIMQFSAEEPAGHRVRVQGIVTLAQPGRGLFISGEGGGLWVQTRQQTPVAPGDQVDVVGFPARGDFNPSLENAIYRRLGSGPAMEPRDFVPENGFGSRQDAELLRVEAVVLDQMRAPEQELFILQAGQTTISATLDNAPPGGLRIPNGSKVRLTGVCSVRANDFRIPQTFRLLLGSPQDIVLLRRPPWWTIQRVLWVAGGLAVVLLLAVAWSVVLARKNAALSREIRDRHVAEGALRRAHGELERRVEERTGQLSRANEALRDQVAERGRAEARLVAVQLQHLLEKERARIARDIHDDLGARLTQIKLLSELVENHADEPESVGRHTRRISAVTRDLTQSMDEIVWAVDPRNDTLESLTSYLYKFAQDYLGTAAIRCRLDAPVDLPDVPLSTDVRHHLFLAFKESLNNIVKHATATEVWIRLRLDLDQLIIFIEDNGCGLTSGNGRASNGHGPPGSNGNGLANMKKRLEDVGGKFEFESRHGQGTRLKLAVLVESGDSPVPNTGD